MSLVKVKSTVRPKLVVILAAAINAATDLGLTDEVYITSGNDGQHMPGSKHYTYEALDFRTKHLPVASRTQWIDRVRQRLGPQYDVLLEHAGQSNEHLHVEVQER